MAFFLARAAGETGPWYKSRLFWGGVAACGVLMVVNDHLDAKIAARGPPSDRVLEEANEWESDAEALREIRERNPHLKRSGAVLLNLLDCDLCCAVGGRAGGGVAAMSWPGIIVSPYQI